MSGAAVRDAKAVLTALLVSLNSNSLTLDAWVQTRPILRDLKGVVLDGKRESRYSVDPLAVQ